ncbi:MAG TPA: GyrI-like domain-containing protein [Methanoculleus sp.]|nr:GyrI-like domain-containing protein [Methanoculleus sp.]
MEDVEVVEVARQVVLGLRRRGSYPQIATMIGELVEFAMAHGVQIAGPPVFVCHEMSPEEAFAADAAGNADIEVAFPILGTTEGSGEMRVYELPGGTMATIVHRGAYENATPTYEKLYAWLERSQKSIAGPLREVYLNDPREVPEEEILTEIYAPIE